MNVVDSSGWLEYFAEEANGDFFAPAIENPNTLIVPTISMYEVFKRVYSQTGADDALKIVAQMAQGKVIDLTQPLALQAAKLSMDYKLPMADSVILATAQWYQATLWTQDEHFKSVPDVRYKPKPKA
jgi:predicted nucleic acid-binding protein